jgi:hypothetical protein
LLQDDKKKSALASKNDKSKNSDLSA